MFDATFWVAISFLIFIALLIYKKVPGLINKVLDDKISEIKKKVEESEKLKNDSEKLLSTYQAKLNDSKKECDLILQNAKRISDKDSKELTEKFKNNLKSRERSVEEKITNLKNEALKEIELKAAMLSADAVREIMKNEIDEKKRADINFTSIKQSINKINS
jgi:F-type H+-transporting ATPase subunit b|tara:strand:- start:365 stop:850 length:486 start_codon:yes stop_codon:yes gene_type:complete